MTQPKHDAPSTSQPNLHDITLFRDEFDHFVLLVCQTLQMTRGEHYHSNKSDETIGFYFDALYAAILFWLHKSIYRPNLLKLESCFRLTIASINLECGVIELTFCYKNKDGTAKLHLKFLRVKQRINK